MMRSHATQWITGPAGSGKTWLLIKKVIELAQKMKDGKMLVLCSSSPLCKHLQKQFWLELKQPINDEHSFIHVCTHSDFLRMHRYHVSPPCYQHIFVDEGQDLPNLFPNENWFESIKPFLQGNDGKRHYLWVMYDSNQHLGPSEGNLPPSIQQEVANSYQLRTVLRNGKNISEMVEKYYSANDEIKLGHKGLVGLNITWDNSLSDEQQHGGMVVVKHVKRLTKENVQLKDICVLSEDETKRERIAEALHEQSILNQNAMEHIMSESQAVIVESIEQFKGLESKVVILFDPPFFPTEERSNLLVKKLLYTAVSRCTCYLIVVSTSGGCEALKSKLGYLHIQNKEIVPAIENL